MSTITFRITDKKGNSLTKQQPPNVEIKKGGITVQPVGDEIQLRDYVGDVTLSIAVSAKKKDKDITDFDRLFPDLPAFKPDTQACIRLGASNGPMFDPNADADDNPGGEHSWATYYGQFIDHDTTLDKTPFVDAPIDTDELTNFRDPRFNLDSVFGGGPSVNPELYDSTGRFILSQDGRDLQRDSSGKAIIAEARNDENLIICQIQVAYYRLYNKLRDLGYSYEEARLICTLQHQQIVIKHFLPAVIPQPIIDKALANSNKLYNPPGKDKNIFMPLEFSVACYRFGHSMVRRAYVMGADQLKKTQVFNPAFPAVQDLRGGRPIPSDLIIQWSNFDFIPATNNPQPPVNVPRKIDEKLSSGLFALPPDAAPSGPIELAQRNLIRGKSYGLPSGQDVAIALGFTPLSNDLIGLTDPAFGGKAPLWYYILSEAKYYNNGAKLGPVGGTVVAETIIGILREDKESILNKNKKFQSVTGGTSFGHLVKFAGVAS